jgi:hypothetical protein
MDKDQIVRAPKPMKRCVMRSAVIASTLLMLGAAVILPSSAVGRDRRDRDEMSEPTANQILDLTDARIARFKADLRLTPDQEKNWSAIQTGFHDMAQRRADRMLKLRKQRTTTRPEAQHPDTKEGTTQDGRVPGNEDWTTIDEMRLQADTLSASAEDLRKIADATGPLYDSLDSSQRRRFGAFISQYFSDERKDGWRR